MGFMTEDRHTLLRIDQSLQLLAIGQTYQAATLAEAQGMNIPVGRIVYVADQDTWYGQKTTGLTPIVVSELQ